MGGNNSKKTNQQQQIIDHTWTQINRGDHYNVICDKNGIQANEYTYILDNRYLPRAQKQIFDQRKEMNAPIVKVYSHQTINKGTALAPKNQFKVITQRISHRLSDCPQLTFPQSLYVLQNSLTGYQILYDKVGPFRANSNMIGFTPEGECKVWLHQNFGINQPMLQQHVLQSTANEGRMHWRQCSKDQVSITRNIISLVEQKCEEGKFPQPFKSKIHSQAIDFNDAKRIIYEELNNPDIIRVNKLDLINNLIKKKVTKYEQTPVRQSRSLDRMNNSSQYVNRLVHNVLPQNQVIPQRLSTSRGQRTSMPRLTTQARVNPVSSINLRTNTQTRQMASTSRIINPTRTIPSQYNQNTSLRKSNVNFSYGNSRPNNTQQSINIRR